MIDEKLQRAELAKVQDGWTPIRVAYDPAFLSDFKRAIPASARAWDGGDKVWYISPDFMPEVKRLIRRHFTYLDGVSYTSAWWILHLREGAPPHLIEAAAAALLENENRADQRRRIEAARQLLLTL